MSAVEDVEARLCRLEEAWQVAQTHALELSTQRSYDPRCGIDRDLQGGSLATLEIGVVRARQVRFQSGFLAGGELVVRAMLDSGRQECNTSKQPVASTPRWHETLTFEGLDALDGDVRIQIVQRGRLGVETVCGAMCMPLRSLQDQRVQERWHDLAVEDQPSDGQLFLRCRLNRSVLCALELESTLLQNQIQELRAYLQRQHELRPTTWPFSSSGAIRISTEAIRNTPVLHTPIVAIGKRERRESDCSTITSSSSSSSPKFPLASPTVVDTAMDVEPQFKRRKLDSTRSRSFSERLANWLLPPTTPTSSEPTATFPFQHTNTPQRQVQRKPHDRKAIVAARRKARRFTFDSFLFGESDNAAEAASSETR